MAVIPKVILFSKKKIKKKEHYCLGASDNIFMRDGKNGESSERSIFFFFFLMQLVIHMAQYEKSMYYISYEKA